ncbi:hypothetical protein CRG98_046186 [Punica granatum]|nr:hypothetical protein CRG98_046186 [Punica granatum]
MDTKGRLVAGSHNRNEFILINADEVGRLNSVKELSAQVCQICSDEIEFTENGEPFVACNECAFPVCRTCYEYERREGNQACPQCKTRYKRIKGSPRVEWDEEEEDTDDLENEFDIMGGDDPRHVAEAILSARLNAGRGSHYHVTGTATPSEFDASSVVPEVPLLTYGHEDVGISSDRHALIIPPFMGRGSRICPTAYPDPSVPFNARTLDPNKDLAVYGYGTVAWKQKMEGYKKKQIKKLEVVKNEGAGNDGGQESGDPDLPM